MHRLLNHAAALAAAVLFLLVASNASAAAQGAQEGLSVALSTAIPALFPFFVLSGLLIRSGAVSVLGRWCAPLIRRVYGLPGEAAGPLVLGLTGGYPVGAQAVRELYDTGVLSREEAARLLGFCNNTGPAFLIGVCGAGLCGSVRTGVLLYLVHIAAALATGLFLAAHTDGSCRTSARPAPKPLPFSVCLTQSTQQAARACLSITAFIMLFSMLRRVLEAAGLFASAAKLCVPLLWFLGAPAESAQPLLVSLLEMTGGLVLLPGCTGRALLPAMSFVVGFGGLSVLCQTAAAAGDLPLGRLVCGKVLHGLLAAGLTMLIQAVLPLSAPVFAPAPAVLPSHPAAGLLCGVLSVFCITLSGKTRRNRL